MSTYSLTLRLVKGSKLTFSELDNNFLYLQSIISVGATGSQGPQGYEGSQGVQGVQGDQGPQGYEGLQGYEGPQGVQGVQGDQGPQGMTGSQGASGISYDSGSFDITIDGNDSVILSSKTFIIAAPYNGTITDWNITGWSASDGTGNVSIVLDLSKNGTSMIGTGNKPTLTDQTNNYSSITGWTTATFSRNDLLKITIDSVTNAIASSCVFYVTKNQ